MSYFPCELSGPAAASTSAVEWEEPDCLMCGSSETTAMVEGPDVTAGGSGLWFAAVQCQECGLCYTNPRPSRASIGQFYPAAYRPHGARKRRQKKPWPWRLQPEIYPDIPWHGQGRLLDFGCGGGGFLTRMQAQGWNTTGLDVSHEAVERARSHFGLSALHGSLPHPDLNENSFDVVTMWESLEHVHAPREVLEEVHRLLAPGGLLYVSVPNIDSTPFRWFSSDWYALDLPRHLVHFSPMTLSLMLEKVGFRVMGVKIRQHSQWLRYSARRAAKRKHIAAWQRSLIIKPVARWMASYLRMSQQGDNLLVTAAK